MRFGWTVFVIPFLFVFSGTLLMEGHPLVILLDSATAVAGVWLISAATMGYGLRPLAVPYRLFYGAAGLFLLIPLEALEIGRWINIAGACMVLALLIRERGMHRKLAPAKG
jgi:TRAP-type uncharacterized transport system fused permease subunit